VKVGVALCTDVEKVGDVLFRKSKKEVTITTRNFRLLSGSSILVKSSFRIRITFLVRTGLANRKYKSSLRFEIQSFIHRASKFKLPFPQRDLHYNFRLREKQGRIRIVLFQYL